MHDPKTAATRRPRRLRLVAPVAAFGLLLVTACGGGGAAAEVASLENRDPVAAGDIGSGDATATTIDTEEAMLAFTQCMRDQGVDIADPTVDADGNLRFSRPGGAGGGDFSEGERESLRAAREACAGFLDGVAQGFRNVDETELQDNLLAYAQCMRDTGYEQMQDPDFSTFGPGAGPPGEGFRGPFGEIDVDDPAYQAADAACRDLFGGLGRGGPGGLGRGPGGDG